MLKGDNSWKHAGLLVIGAVVVYGLAGYLDILERIVDFSHQHEKWEIDELLTVLVAGIAYLVFFLFKKTQEVKALNRELEIQNGLLEKAIGELKTLRGIIPICSYCKNIRSDSGEWAKLEKYIMDHSEAKFSHGICENCLVKYHAEFIPKK